MTPDFPASGVKTSSAACVSRGSSASNRGVSELPNITVRIPLTSTLQSMVLMVAPDGQAVSSPECRRRRPAAPPDKRQAATDSAAFILREMHQILTLQCHVTQTRGWFGHLVGFILAGAHGEWKCYVLSRSRA